jgi:putative addiction module CopG family antidote
MNNSLSSDVQQLIADHLASGRYANQDEVLRDALLTLREVDDEVAAIQSAIDEWRSGDHGVTLDEAFASVRAEATRKHER